MTKNSLFNKDFSKKYFLPFIQSNVPLMGLFGMIAAVTILDPVFLSSSNILNVLRQSSTNGLIALGMTMVILTGGIDLSVGASFAFSGIVLADSLKNGLSDPLAILLALLIGGGLGLFNGLLISKGKVQPFIATLGTLTMFRGLSLVYSKGIPISNLSRGGLFQALGRGTIGSIPTPIIILLLAFIILSLLMKQTAFGKKVYAIGGNEQAARLCGLRIDRVKISVYTITGILAALAGILVSSRLDSAQPTMGIGYELDAIAAVVLGGTSLSGGRGSIGKTLVGVLLLATLNNALNILEVSGFYQQIIKGGIILLAVILDRKEH